MNRRRIMRLTWLPILLLFTACASGPDFRHDIATERKPWTNERFDSGDDKFMFAVHSDLAGGERERVFEVAVAQLALLRPEFIMNVGDLIEGDAPDAAGLNAQWESFDARANRAKAPVFYTGGNHDLTGEVLQGIWDQRYGRRYYHFVYRNVLFLVLDTEDNSAERNRQVSAARNHALRVLEEEGEDAFARTEYADMPERTAGNIGDAQAQYFRNVIAANAEVRWTFLFMHKAPWLREDMATFTAIEDALAGRKYTVFSGHFHAYGYQERRGRDYLSLATTGGAQAVGGGRAVDHVTLVTVADDGVDIANLLLEGILDKTGHVPLDGDDVCFEAALCQGSPSQTVPAATTNIAPP